MFGGKDKRTGSSYLKALYSHSPKDPPFGDSSECRSWNNLVAVSLQTAAERWLSGHTKTGERVFIINKSPSSPVTLLPGRGQLPRHPVIILSQCVSTEMCNSGEKKREKPHDHSDSERGHFCKQHKASVTADSILPSRCWVLIIAATVQMGKRRTRTQ